MHYFDGLKLRKHFSYFSCRGKNFLDEISHSDAQRWVNTLEASDYRESTVKSYVTMMAKVYNYFIDTSGELDVKNPFRKVFVSRKGTLTSDHLPKDEEIRRLLETQLPEKSGHTVPIEDIVKFAILPGLANQRSSMLNGVTSISIRGSGASESSRSAQPLTDWAGSLNGENRGRFFSLTAPWRS